MANHYRVYGEMNWASASGNALLTLTNPASSTKLLKVKSFEVRPVARKQTTLQANVMRLMRVSGLPASTTQGLEVALTKLDTNTTTPSGVRCMKNVAYTAGDVAMSVLVAKKFSDALALNRFTRHVNIGPFKGVEPSLANRASAMQRVTVRDGEQAALVCATVDRGLPLRIEALLRYNGATFRTVSFAIATTEGLAVWAVDNANGLGNSLEIDSIAVSEVGDTTTPFFQLVPLNPKPERLTDAAFAPSVVAYDTDAAAFSGIATFASDVPCSPANGIPEQYISDASAGSPKGVNYLHTKDFLGPSYMVYFPEHDANGVGVRGDTFGLCVARQRTQISDHIAPIVVRPGESIGLVTSAELATGTTAVPVSGFAPFEFGCDVEVTDLVTPTIEFTGLQTGSKVAIVDANTETLVTLLTETAGTATYSGFTSNPGTYWDARILCAGYVFQQINDIEQLAEVQTYAITQEADLVYDALASEAVTFDGSTKRIICDTGNTSLNVPYVYSKWVGWALTSNNLAYYHAFENQGGTDIDPGAGTTIPKYCYLVNSWKVRPQEASHTLSVTDGILLVSGGGDPFVNTLGSYTVRVNYQQPVQAITVSTGGGSGTGDWTTTEKEQIRNRLGIDGSASTPTATPTLATAADIPTAVEVGDAVRTELAPELANLDAQVSKTLTTGKFIALNN